MVRRRGRAAFAVVLGTVVCVQLLAAAPSSATETCSTLPVPSTGTRVATVTLCLQSPALGATVSGQVEVAATISSIDPPGAVVMDRMTFWWGPLASPAYVLGDHDAPYRMVLDTTLMDNGTDILSVRPVFTTGAVTARVGGTVTVDNPPPPPDDKTFTPWLGGPKDPGERFRLAVVGDGVDGSDEEHAVADVIAAAKPDAFAYLGDVYDRGTDQEFYNWYRVDQLGFGRFLDITNPTLGNHEYMVSPTAEWYFEFWHKIKHYYAYDVGAWHVVSIDSNTEFGQLGDKSEQYTWLKRDLEANTDKCTLLYAHHSRVTNVDGVNRGGLEPEWDLMVDNGGDLMLGGHAHTYERWLPMDGDQVPVTEGLTEFVAGTGGRRILNAKHPDARTAADVTTPGALLLDLGDIDANYTFLSADGTYTDTGTIPCRTAPTVEPEVTSTLPGDEGWARGDVTVHWDVADLESPNTLTTTGCDDVVITADQPETTYTCTARSGGGLKSKKVTVKRDGTPPVVTTAVEPPEPDGSSSWYVSAPAVSFSCSDVTSGVAHCPDDVGLGEGTSTVTRTGRDVAGNSTEASVGPLQVDLTDPVVTCEPKPTFLLNLQDALLARVTDTATGSGPVPGTERAVAETSVVGDQSQPVRGTDVAGRTSSKICDYRVIYGFSGFQPPVNDGPDVTNVVKVGKVVPLKWALADAAGVPVTTLGSAQVSSVSHSCATTAGDLQDPVAETAVGGSGLQNFGDGSYQLNWRAPTSYAGSCRTVRLDLGDDLLRTLEFRFTA